MNAHSVLSLPFTLATSDSPWKGQLSQMMRIEKAAVLGAGTMGAGLAAHFANAGIPVLLLDIAPRELNAEETKKGLTLDAKAGA
jgi:NADPH-dependent 2,4-dienoyl-CoA reductase/sulfur reductase-like enzyme